MSQELPKSLAFSGYHRKLTAEPDRALASVERGTPGGEYHRRFWHPVALVSELGKVPLRIRALGEDLVAFRDGEGRIGVLHLHCCHRNTSLEYGVITERGLRCCYHGRLYDVDGTILEVPGDPNADHIRAHLSQGSYPTHVFGGLVFVYMGPPDRVPVFAMYDRFRLPGIEIVPGPRLPLSCNWLQLKENTVDPHHTAILHVIPQLRGMDHFADEFGNFPELTWAETPAGVAYFGARRSGENVWVRSAETLGPNIHCISSIFESGRTPKLANPPFITFWTLPVDDEHSINFFVSHVVPGEEMPFAKRRELEIFGQWEDRPYADRQWIPGDHDAMVSQGSINPHGLEHLGGLDRGVVMFRRFIRRGIDAVERGEDPQGFYLGHEDVPPTFASDRVVQAAEIDGLPEGASGLRVYAERLAKDYLQSPPMGHLDPSAGR
jgi:phenylpropionate dioxygenase-like ring-hydroxylating dioxygenase large terminal subunit